MNDKSSIPVISFIPNGNYYIFVTKNHRKWGGRQPVIAETRITWKTQSLELVNRIAINKPSLPLSNRKLLLAPLNRISRIYLNLSISNVEQAGKHNHNNSCFSFQKI
jgi:DNA modification methylase